MIKDRPEGLLSQPWYNVVPPPPYALDGSTMPPMIQFTMLCLDGIQPLTGKLAAAGGGVFTDAPSEGQIEYLRSTNTRFQLILVVTSYILAGVDESNNPVMKPFAVNLFPASKRGKVEQTRSVDLVVGVLLSSRPYAGTVYAGFNPFSGAYGLFGPADVLLSDKPRNGFIDEIGLVTDAYVLATDYDPEDVCAPNFDMPSAQLFQKYVRHRTKLFFTPFKDVAPRRVWGVESPIELFLLQGMAYHGFVPLPQMIIMDDGSVFPSLYDLWSDGGFSRTKEAITEADFYFPDQKVAVFCDGSHHLRRRQRERDARIDEKLGTLGIRSIRVQGRQIMQDIDESVHRVINAVR